METKMTNRNLRIASEIAAKAAASARASLRDID